ncbi:hypothetical protein [Nocardia callitridis]
MTKHTALWGNSSMKITRPLVLTLAALLVVVLVSKKRGAKN